MARYISGKIVRENLAQHPAVHAWSQACPDRAKPAAITILKENPRKPEIFKSAVYRLEGVGTAGEAVIAKLTKKETALVECQLYQEILPQLPMPSLYFYGSYQPVEDDVGWFFIEDAGEQAYAPDIHEHRVAAGRTLGITHTAVAYITSRVALPSRGTRHYLEHLQSATNIILETLNHPALSNDISALLQAICTQLGWLEDHWCQIERICEDWPQVLAHGDFGKKNLHVRQSETGITVLAVDWEMAGWGEPGPDIASGAAPDLITYLSVMKGQWPEITLKGIQEFASIGLIFRLVAAIAWAAESLQYIRDDRRAIRYMRIYKPGLAEAISNLQIWR